MECLKGTKGRIPLPSLCSLPGKQYSLNEGLNSPCNKEKVGVYKMLLTDNA